MKTAVTTLALLVGGLFLLVLVVVLMGVSAHNTEVGLRNAFHAQEKVNESRFDTMWKVIQQQAGVAEHERDSFRKTYVEIMNATQGVAGDGQLASFFKQAQINVTPELFSKLMTTIEAQRETFHRDQQHLARIKQQHDDVRTRYPSALFVGGRPELELRLVTSERTGEAFQTGQDNNVDLFPKGT